ncbi:J domain-containing protein [Arcobacteraceae bacterium]|nr:J domain-containing protein [Arcobacteraceae bacterium]
MIKKITIIFFAIIFFTIKKIFVRENRVPHKTMDNIANKLHSLFLFTSFFILYLLWFDIHINTFSLNNFLYVILFLQFLIIIRYFHPKMVVIKVRQVKIMKKINKVFIFLFVFNWIFFAFSFAFYFLLILLLNNVFYLFIINQINKQKEQEQFKKQFGDRKYSQKDIMKKHIVNLFESDLEVIQLTRSDIKKQYRLMAKKYHPDVYSGNEKDKFTSINMSYNFLLDVVK